MSRNFGLKDAHGDWPRDADHSFGRAIIGAIVVLLVAVVLCAWLIAAHARDLGQWENHDQAVRLWFQNLKQPDNPEMSCCGEGDGYWADEVHYRDGQMFAVITDERPDCLPAPDGQVCRLHEDVGTRYAVPPAKITRKDGNPTGHVLIFLGTVYRGLGGEPESPRPVLCYVMNGGV